MSDTTRTRAPREYRREGGRFIKNADAVDPVEAELFFAPSVEVIVARRQKTVWHVVACRTSQTRPDRSGVSVSEEKRVVSADSGVKAAQAVLDAARQRHAMAVMLPIEESLFTVVCPTHDVVHRNSTVDYAIESAYWHALNEHDAVAS